MAEEKLTLFHAPHSRSGGTLALLEELKASYHLEVLNLKAGEQRKAAYLAINPMGKVPAIKHGQAVITEQVAIYIYLADRFRKAGWPLPLPSRSAGLICAGWHFTAPASSPP